jgi:peptidoglycan/LPS O-acetylase OafA/YrhL
MVNGPTEFARQYKAASPTDRARIIASYRDWVFEGARAQGRWPAAGLVLGGGSAFVSVMALLDGPRSPIFIGVLILGVCLGVFSARVAARREREWRKANPWRGPGLVR